LAADPAWAPAIVILVLDARIVTVVVRQFVLPRPPRDLLRLAIGPAVAVLLATVALVEKTLVITLHLVVENDAADRPPSPRSRSSVRW
jgi:hypothetical protein